MQGYFDELATFLTSKLQGDEFATMSFAAEDSDFIRFNHSKVRQGGHVAEKSMSVDLILGARHAFSVAMCTMSSRSSFETRGHPAPGLDFQRQLRRLPQMFLGVLAPLAQADIAV